MNDLLDKFNLHVERNKLLDSDDEVLQYGTPLEIYTFLKGIEYVSKIASKHLDSGEYDDSAWSVLNDLVTGGFFYG